MDNKISRIQELLKKNIFISTEQRKRIEMEMTSLDEGRLDELISILERAEESEKKVIMDAQNANPNFMNELNEAVGKEIRKDLIEKEEIERHDEAAELSDLEEELNSLFE